MARDLNNPVEGYYRARLVRGGPFVPVRIEPITAKGWLGFRGHRCWVNGKEVDVLDVWPWLRFTITRADYRRMLHRALWARRCAPWHWAANPRRPLTPTDLEDMLDDK